MINSVIKKLFYEKAYFIGYRKVNNDDYTYNHDIIPKYTSIKPTLFSCYADPFVVNINNKDYIFAEQYNRLNKKGTICVFSLDSNGQVINCKEIINESYHLSFPNIFEYKNNYYMIPESSQDYSILIYKMLDNPYNWQKIYSYPVDDIVDTSITIIDNVIYLLNSSSKIDNPLMTKQRLFKLTDLETKPQIEEINNKHLSNEYSYENRLGGNIIIDDYINLVIQNSTPTFYGSNITIKSLDIKTYKPIKSKDINCENIKIEELNNSSSLYGLHTYNINSNYEIIDFYCGFYSFNNLITKIFRAIYKIIA